MQRSRVLRALFLLLMPAVLLVTTITPASATTSAWILLNDAGATGHNLGIYSQPYPTSAKTTADALVSNGDSVLANCYINNGSPVNGSNGTWFEISAVRRGSGGPQLVAGWVYGPWATNYGILGLPWCPGAPTITMSTGHGASLFANPTASSAQTGYTLANGTTFRSICWDYGQAYDGSHNKWFLVGYEGSGSEVAGWAYAQWANYSNTSGISQCTA